MKLLNSDHTLRISISKIFTVFEIEGTSVIKNVYYYMPSSTNASYITQTFPLVSCNQRLLMISNASPTCNYDTWYFLHLVFSSSPCSACQSLISPRVCDLCVGVCVLTHYQHTWGCAYVCWERVYSCCQHDLGSVWVRTGQGLGPGLRMKLMLNSCWGFGERQS